MTKTVTSSPHLAPPPNGRLPESPRSRKSSRTISSCPRNPTIPRKSTADAAKRGPADAAVEAAATKTAITPLPTATPWTVDLTTEGETITIAVISAIVIPVGCRHRDTTREEIDTAPDVPIRGVGVARHPVVAVRAILALDRLLPAATGGSIRHRGAEAGAIRRRDREAGASIPGTARTGVVTGQGAIPGVPNRRGANLAAAVPNPNRKSHAKKKSPNPSSMSPPKILGPSLFPLLL